MHPSASPRHCSVDRTRRVESTGLFERDYVLYVIEAHTRGGDSFQIERRYSDFVNFHERWMEKITSPYAPLPELPVLDSIKDKNDPSVVIHRMMLLNLYPPEPRRPRTPRAWLLCQLVVISHNARGATPTPSH